MIYLAYDYHAEKHQLYQLLDNQLEVAAHSVPLILPQDFHHHAMLTGDITPLKDMKNILRL